MTTTPTDARGIELRIGTRVTTPFGHTGTVTALHNGCPENAAWIRLQTYPEASTLRNAVWASVSPDTGGAVTFPVEVLEVLDTERVGTTIAGDWREGFHADLDILVASEADQRLAEHLAAFRPGWCGCEAHKALQVEQDQRCFDGTCSHVEHVGDEDEDSVEAVAQREQEGREAAAQAAVVVRQQLLSNPLLAPHLAAALETLCSAAEENEQAF